MSSKSANWLNGKKSKNHAAGLDKWRQLKERPDLSEGFRRQVERNLREKGGR